MHVVKCPHALNAPFDFPKSTFFLLVVPMVNAAPIRIAFFGIVCDRWWKFIIQGVFLEKR